MRAVSHTGIVVGQVINNNNSRANKERDLGEEAMAHEENKPDKRGGPGTKNISPDDMAAGNSDEATIDKRGGPGTKNSPVDDMSAMESNATPTGKRGGPGTKN